MILRATLIALLTFLFTACVFAQDKPATQPSILSVKKIWDQAPHNAFTDLIRFKDQWFCAFRESQAHVGGNGTIRVLTSTDGETWTSAAAISEDGIDLRDAKLSVTPEGKLMLLCGGSVYEGKKLVGRQPRVSFSDDGKTWTPTQRILSEGDWLWRVTWHEGRAYGFSYKAADKTTTTPWDLALYSSADGIHYDRVTNLEVPDRPNESTVRFLKDGTMIAIVRREGGNQHGWIGTSPAPYTTWKWHETNDRLGGPNLIVLPDATIWSAGRNHADHPHVSLARVTPDSYEPVLDFPSSGDCSYPGMVYFDDILWISYYSSHEGKTSIYLAKVKLN